MSKYSGSLTGIIPMSARKFPPLLAALALFASAAPSATFAASGEKLPLSAEEVNSKRQAVREELMLPSLTGIHSIAYRVVGFKNFEPLEKVMGEKLAKLNIQCDPMVKWQQPKRDAMQSFKSHLQKLVCKPLAI